MKLNRGYRGLTDEFNHTIYVSNLFDWRQRRDADGSDTGNDQALANQHIFLDGNRISSMVAAVSLTELATVAPNSPTLTSGWTAEAEDPPASGLPGIAWDEETMLTYHPDHLGSSVLIFSGNGRPYYRSEMKPYGEMHQEWRAGDPAATAEDPPGTGSGQPLVNHLFTGYERDFETGYDYAQARYYDPEVARFMAVDPAFQSTYWNDHASELIGKKTLHSIVFLAHQNQYSGMLNTPLTVVAPDGKHALVFHDQYHTALIVAKPITKYETIQTSAGPELVGYPAWEVNFFNMQLDSESGQIENIHTKTEMDNITLESLEEWASSQYRDGNLQYLTGFITTAAADDAIIRAMPPPGRASAGPLGTAVDAVETASQLGRIVGLEPIDIPDGLETLNQVNWYLSGNNCCDSVRFGLQAGLDAMGIEGDIPSDNRDRSTMEMYGGLYPLTLTDHSTAERLRQQISEVEGIHLITAETVFGQCTAPSAGDGSC